jgi:hypothetical protein
LSKIGLANPITQTTKITSKVRKPYKKSRSMSDLRGKRGKACSSYPRRYVQDVRPAS